MNPLQDRPSFTQKDIDVFDISDAGILKIMKFQGMMNAVKGISELVIKSSEAGRLTHVGLSHITKLECLTSLSLTNVALSHEAFQEIAKMKLTKLELRDCSGVHFLSALTDQNKNVKVTILNGNVTPPEKKE